MSVFLVSPSGGGVVDRIEGDSYQVENGDLVIWNRLSKFRVKEVARFVAGEWRGCSREESVVAKPAKPVTADKKS